MTRLVVVGDAQAGKTCLIHRVVRGEFEGAKYHPTTTFTFFTYRSDVAEDPQLQLWDTSGVHKRRPLNSTFQAASVALAVFDRTKKSSFENATTFWKTSFEQFAPKGAIFLLVGTKIDDKAEFEVLDNEIAQWAEVNGIPCFLVSSLTGEGIPELIQGIFEAIRKQTQPVVESVTQQNDSDESSSDE